MKLTELMVGDYVKIRDTNKYWRIGGTNDMLFHDDYEPIPLTEEIFVKNGFGKVNNQYFFGQVEIKELRDCWVVIINKEDADVDINIHYVHQLQHLLRLVGVQKEIEL